MADTYTAFVDQQRIAAGTFTNIAKAVKAAFDAGTPHLLVFNDGTGQVLEFDFRGSLQDVLQRFRLLEEASGETSKPAARGRPKLGVTPREVTLLPSHWDWLATQPGGASAALRRLVDKARRSGDDKHRQAQEAARRVMLALAGDLPDFEEATRAFYANDFSRFEQLSATWPADVGEYVRARVQRVAAATPE